MYYELNIISFCILGKVINEKSKQINKIKTVLVKNDGLLSIEVIKINKNA